MLRNATLLRSLAAGSLCLGLVPLVGACSSTVEGKGTSQNGGGDAGIGGTTGSGGDGGGGSSTGGTNAGGSAADGGSSSGGAPGTGGAGTGGSPGPVPPSCEGLPANCGPDGGDDCCASITLDADTFPMGRGSGTDAYNNGEADETPERTATPIDIQLDKYEVTVGRFRKFVEAYPTSKPASGDGAHLGVGNSGWNTNWDAQLDEDDYYLTISLKCSNDSTWTDAPGSDEVLPINCVSWYYAFAFCAWDGGFLPSEADWEFAAAGGSDDRLYPWGSAAPTQTLASFDCKADSAIACEWKDILPVGSLTAGKGKFGHFDLAGNMAEWVFDGYGAGYYATVPNCTNCINLADTTQRVTRGGSYMSEAGDLRAAARTPRLPEYSFDSGSPDRDSGFRCARAVTQ